MLFSTQTTILRNANWTSTPGNYIEYTYFDGPHLRNPSANPDNLDTIRYFNGLSEQIFSVQYTWDSLDRIILEESI